MYEADFADIYDLIYQHRGKDYQGEAVLLAGLVRGHLRTAESVLDVACGTGGHLRFLRDQFTVAEGLEVSPEMLAIARKRLPDGSLHQGDMRDFTLGRKYDGITLMFSSIGYVTDKADLDRTLACLARHLTPGGVVIIEPWVFPDTFVSGYVASDLVVDPESGRTIARLSHSVRDGDAVRMTVHYLTGDAGGIRHLSDTHWLALFTREEYEDAFARAGCRAEFIRPDGFSRGLFVGVNLR
jgi:SAM-dependent methyltransferase